MIITIPIYFKKYDDVVITLDKQVLVRNKNGTIFYRNDSREKNKR